MQTSLPGEMFMENVSVNRKRADLAFARLELDDIMGHFLLVQCSRSEFTDPQCQQENPSNIFSISGFKSTASNKFQHDSLLNAVFLASASSCLG